jgi:antitoxin ParD1/3/4
MNLQFPPDLQRFVDELVESGEYVAPAEVVLHAMYLFREHEAVRKFQLERLRAEMQIGIDQLERGEYTTWNSESPEELVEFIIERHRKRMAEVETPEHERVQA